MERDGVDWIHLAQVMDKFRDVVNAVMNFWLSESVGDFFV
jgi:hypothetical protein